VDVLTGMFPDKMQDFVLSINENDVAIIKQISGTVTAEDLEKIAVNVEDTLKNELRIKTIIGIGTVAEQTGFASAAHFRRVFREVMGISPLQYRKGHKK